MRRLYIFIITINLLFIYSFIYFFLQCTVTCGNGVQTREAVCVDEFEKLVDDAMCASAEKIIQKLCVLGKCSIWWMSDWSSVRIHISRNYLPYSSAK